MKRQWTLLAGCTAFMLLCGNSGCNEQAATSSEKTTEQQPEKVMTPIEPAKEKVEKVATDIKGPQVVIRTKFGNMIAVLYDETPQHRDNFLKLVKLLKVMVK